MWREASESRNSFECSKLPTGILGLDDACGGGILGIWKQLSLRSRVPGEKQSCVVPHGLLENQRD